MTEQRPCAEGLVPARRTPWLSRRGSGGRQALTVVATASGAFHFRLFTITPGHVSLLRDFGELDSDVPAALREAGCPLRRDADVIVLLPRRHVLVRHLQLPARDPGQLARMMPYEAFTASPWPREETLYTYVTEYATAEGSSLVSLYLARLEVIEAHLVRLKALNVYPTQIEVSTRGLTRLLRSVSPAEPTVSLLLAAGGETEYLRLAPHGAVFSRAASAGEETPSETLQRALDIDGRASLAGTRSETLIVAGTPLSEVLDRSAGLPARVVPLEEVSFSATNGLAPLSPGLALAAGAALLAAEPVSTANLLPPSYLRWLEPQRLIRRLRLPAVLLLWFAGTLAGLAYFQYEGQQARAAEARARIEALGADTRELEAKNEALALLSAERARVRRPLEIVLELYERTPPRIAINSMRLEPGRSLILGCEAPDFTDAFAYLDQLKESPLLSAVELITSTRPRASQDGLVEFKVKCLPKPVSGGREP